MAAFTASVTGNWADTATWGGSGPPGDGDTVTINDGITVTIPVSTTVTIGASPDDDTSTPAIQSASSTGTGKLIVNGTLNFRGSIRQADSTWEVGPNAICEHDSQLATTPSSTNYTWQIGMKASYANKLQIRGTSGNRAIFRNNASSGRCGGFTDGGFTGGGSTDFEYATITGWGLSGTGNGWLRQNMKTATAYSRLVNVITDDCHALYWNHGNMHVDAWWQWQRCSFKNMAGNLAYDIWESSSADESASGNREVTDSFIDGSIQVTYARNCNMDGTVIYGSSGAKVFDDGGGLRNGIASWLNGMIVQANTTGARTLTRGTVTGVLAMRNDDAGTEMDFMRGFNALNDGTNFIDNVLIAEGAGQDGEWLIAEGSATNETYTITGNLALPAEFDGRASGTLITRTGGASSTYLITADNNTIVTNYASAGSIEPIFAQTESVAAVAGTFVSLRNNLLANLGTGRAGYVTYDPVPGTVADDCYTVADYNFSYGITGDQYNDQAAKYAATPGGNDEVADPEFVDDTLSFTSWFQSVDGTLSDWDDYKAEHMKMNDDSGFNSALGHMNFYTAARAAYAPTNTALQGAGYDGSDIGAIAVAVSSAIRKNNSGMLRRVGRVNQLG
jgi:hypothetical protein